MKKTIARSLDKVKNFFARIESGKRLLVAAAIAAALTQILMPAITNANPDKGCPAMNFCRHDGDCDNGKACDGKETCSHGVCHPGIPVNCWHSPFNLPQIATCHNFPDGNFATWDYRRAFASKCQEPSGFCSRPSDSDKAVISACILGKCHAKCGKDADCAETVCTGASGLQSECQGNDLLVYSNVANTCGQNCDCSKTECGAPVVKINDPACTQCQSDADCACLTKTRCDGNAVLQDAGYCDASFTCQTKSEKMNDCDNGIFCDGAETCSAGACVAGTSVDCANSPFNLAEIAACDNDPDNNQLTWDYRAAFTSVCSEAIKECTQIASDTVTHACSQDCGAVCSTGSQQDCAVSGYKGIQTCDSSCNWSTCAAAGQCGDNIVNGSEACDGGSDCNTDCTKKAVAGASAASEPSGGISGDFMPGYGQGGGNRANPRIAGAAIDLDEIQIQIELIREKINDIVNQVGKLGKGIMGAATEVVTGVCDGGPGGDFEAAAPDELRAELCLPE